MYWAKYNGSDDGYHLSPVFIRFGNVRLRDHQQHQLDNQPTLMKSRLVLIFQGKDSSVQSQQFDQSPHKPKQDTAPFETMPEPLTPLEWLWQELAQRFGPEATNEIHRGFNKQQQVYQKSRTAKERQRREQELQRAREEARKSNE